VDRSLHLLINKITNKTGDSGFGYILSDFNFLTNTFIEVIKCRNFIVTTYVMYMMIKSEKIKDVFNDQQKAL